jgi:GH25 family lysozyme M1 (1,4-beta-N-acetylmuramidase)
VVLYTGRDFWLNVDSTSYAGDGLWIADYVTAGKPRIKAKWRFHQYTDESVDRDVADFESEAALRAWAGSA